MANSDQEDIVKLLRRLASLETRIHGTPFRADIYRRAYAKIVELQQQVEELQGEKLGLKRCGLCGTMEYPVNAHNDCYICANAQYAD